MAQALAQGYLWREAEVALKGCGIGILALGSSLHHAHNALNDLYEVRAGRVACTDLVMRVY